VSRALQPFRIDVPDDVLIDLRERLARTRWPDEIPDQGWRYGTSLAYLQDLCETWRTKYDWRAYEARFNAWDHIVTEIDGTQVHAIHAPSPEPDAMPLVVTHGWPGSVSEFLDVIEPLRNPRAHGGEARDAFHVVVPSIPGYGWSGPTHDPGWDVRRVALAWKELMSRLGYARYGAQGGDWGSMISTQLGVVDAPHVAGVHINMVLGAPPPEGSPPLTAAEQADLDALGAFTGEGSAYQQIQGKNPQTLGYGLTDSPAGLAGWIVEKFHHWTHHPDGDLETAVTREQILTNLTVYWVTTTINSSVRLYFESMHPNRFPPFERVEVPTGCAVFPGELLKMPRAWAEQLYNVVHYERYDRGGHFAAMEEPDLFVADVRKFFRLIR
jgi:microsomal epoxide hydrolase